MGLMCCIEEYFSSGIWLVVLIAVITQLANIFKSEKKEIAGKHVLITGGSSGIGLALAHEVVAKGASVTLVARGNEKLQEAQKEIISKGGPQTKVHIISADISDAAAVEAMVEEAETNLGPIFMLVACAGFARAQKFEDISPQLAKQMVDVNFLGSFYAAQSVVRRLKQGTEGGVLLFTSSMGGLLGLYGYTAYAASKAALVKMAEALSMEVKPYNVSVTVSYPPDTDTPGLEEENRTKPIETQLISEAGGLFKASEVASAMLDDALAGRFSSWVGFEGFMLSTMSAGMGPVTHVLPVLAQIFLNGLFRFISVFYLWSFDRIVKKEHDKRLSSKKSE